MPATNPKNPRFDRTSAAILDAAARVFAEEGAAANLATIATAAGISRATLYRYYASREALLDALVVDAIAEAADRLAGAALERASIDDAIGRIVRAFVAVGDRYAVLVSDLPRVDKADMGSVERPVEAVLARGTETGALRDDLTAPVLKELLAGAALSAIRLIRYYGLGLEEASAAAASLFLDGARMR